MNIEEVQEVILNHILKLVRNNNKYVNTLLLEGIDVDNFRFINNKFQLPLSNIIDINVKEVRISITLSNNLINLKEGYWSLTVLIKGVKFIYTYDFESVDLAIRFLTDAIELIC